MLTHIQVIQVRMGVIKMVQPVKSIVMGVVNKLMTAMELGLLVLPLINSQAVGLQLQQLRIQSFVDFPASNGMN